MKKMLTLTAGLAVLAALLPATVHARTWGEITFLPKESFWDEELQDYLLGDSFELLIRNPDTFGLEQSLAISCSYDDFGGDPNVLFYSINIVFKGTGANNLPVSAGGDDIFAAGDIFPVRFSTPSREFTENWEWSRYEDDYIGGMPPAASGTALSYGDIKNMDWIRIETMGQSFLLEMANVLGYMQGFDRKCGEM